MPLQWLYRVSKVTDLDLQRWEKQNWHHDLVERCETPYMWFSEEKAEEYYVKPLMPYATRVEDIARYYNYRRLSAPAYIVDMTIIAYWNTSWREESTLLNAMRNALPSGYVLESGCYYSCNEDMLKILYEDLVERGIEPDFDPKNWENEHLVYYAWC
jgi:hypothetical protein